MITFWTCYMENLDVQLQKNFLKPYNEKLYAIDLTKLDKDAMGRFFPYANKEQIINNMKNSKDVSYNNSFFVS